MTEGSSDFLPPILTEIDTKPVLLKPIVDVSLWTGLAKGERDAKALQTLPSILEKHGEMTEDLMKLFGEKELDSKYSNGKYVTYYKNWEKILLQDGDLENVVSFIKRLVDIQSQEDDLLCTNPSLDHIFEDNQFIHISANITQATVHHLNTLSPEDRMNFIQNTLKAMDHNIPVGFVRIFKDFSSTYDQFDFSKKDLSRFGDTETQSAWLNYLSALWVTNPNTLEKSGSDYEQALQLDTEEKPVNPQLYQAARTAIQNYLGNAYGNARKSGENPMETMLSAKLLLLRSIPSSLPILNHFFSVHERLASVPSYNEVLEGRHPDLVRLSRDQVDGDRRVRLAVDLTLRDIFTPICQEFASSIGETDSIAIQEVQHQFTTPIGKDTYPENLEQLESMDIPDFLKTLIQANTNPKKLTHGHDVNSLEGLSRFHSFYWAHTDVDHQASSGIAANYILMPVGAYGDDFTRRLVETTKLMLVLTEQYDRGTANATKALHKDILSEESGRTKDDYGNKLHPTEERIALEHHAQPTRTTLQEGIISIAQVVSLLMAEKIDGFDDPDTCLEEIIKQNIVNYMALNTNMGYIGPKILGGRHLGKILSQDSSGSIRLAPDFASHIKQGKNTAAIHLDEKANRFDRPGYRPKERHRSTIGETGYGCPVSRRGQSMTESGVESLSNAFLHIFKNIE